MASTPLFETETKATDAMVDVLVEAGIDTVFSVVGGHSVELHAAFEKRDDIRLVFLRQETLAAPMAETYGRLTGKPGVFIGQGQWVAGWGWTGIQEALLSNSPMILLTDFSEEEPHSLHAPYQGQTGHYGSMKLEQALGAICKEVFTARSAAEAVAATQLAIKHATSGAPGPVAVVSTFAAYSGTVGPDSVPRLYHTDRFLSDNRHPAIAGDIAAAADAIGKAEKVVIISGNGVRGSKAQAQLQEFAELIGAPVATSVSGKGTFPEAHPLALGIMGGWGAPTATNGIADADLIIAVGTKLGVSDTLYGHPSLIDPRRQTLVQVDIEPRNAGWTFPVEYPLVGDAKTVLSQLSAALNGIEASKNGYARVEALRAEHGYFDEPNYDSNANPIHAHRLIGDLMRALPENVLITCDAGENRIFMARFYQTRPGDELIQTGTGPMGYAVPAAMAAQLVHPDRPVVAVTGDGGFGMSLNGLMNANEEGINITVVVMNNSYLGMSYHRSRTDFGTYLGHYDYAAVAETMGCHGIRVTDPSDLAAAIKEATSEARPTVIDVVMSKELSYQDFQNSTGASVMYTSADSSDE